MLAWRELLRFTWSRPGRSARVNSIFTISVLWRGWSFNCACGTRSRAVGRSPISNDCFTGSGFHNGFSFYICANWLTICRDTQQLSQDSPYRWFCSFYSDGGTRCRAVGTRETTVNLILRWQLIKDFAVIEH